jgi:hypothetical protein
MSRVKFESVRLVKSFSFLHIIIIQVLFFLTFVFVVKSCNNNVDVHLWHFHLLLWIIIPIDLYVKQLEGKYWFCSEINKEYIDKSCTGYVFVKRSRLTQRQVNRLLIYQGTSMFELDLIKSFFDDRVGL